MSPNDFGFLNCAMDSIFSDATATVASNFSHKHCGSLPLPNTSQDLVSDSDGFMRIVGQSSQIKCHRDLFQLLQGNDIQRFIPHQVLISAWGDFNTPDLKTDVVSAIAGLRTGLLAQNTFDFLIRDLHKRWFVHGRRPLLLDSSHGVRLPYSACSNALYTLFRGNWSLLVHGVTDARTGGVSLYLALNARSTSSSQGVGRITLLTAPVITQIDIAFRRIAALKRPELSADQVSPASQSVLSTREREILRLVAEGKTNIDIAKILAISAFTVKNHMQRIIKKLNAANRTEAVSNYHLLNPQQPQRRNAASSPCAIQAQA